MSSNYTIVLSVVFSTMLALISVYLPLAVTIGNLFYWIFPTVSIVLLGILTDRVTRHMKHVEEQLKKDIIKLKKQYIW
jgi:hypothetical protein